LKTPRLFHISEMADIKIFEPRPSPSAFPGLNKPLVFAISQNLLHNYLLPRDCPRVTYHKKRDSTEADIERFFGNSHAEFVMAIESGWTDLINKTTLNCYEFPTETFRLLDETAGYYISYSKVEPIEEIKIHNPFKEISKRKNVDLRILPSLHQIASEIAASSLGFSLIRMRNSIINKKK
jgi:hypothetical protein